MARKKSEGEIIKTESLDKLRKTIEQIEKSFGAGTIMRLGDNVGMLVDGIALNIPSLDHALGGAGLPKGRIVEMFGAESSGKTTLALAAIAAVQKSGGVAAFIDAENALDPTWCVKLGVDIETMLVSQPNSAEEALQVAELLVDSGQVSIIVIDSVAGMVPQAELDGEIGDSHVGVMARLMSQALRKLTGKVKKSNCILIFINQIRDKIGGMSFGPTTTTTGGRALKFYSSVRAEVTRIGAVKQGDDVVGSRVKVKIVKNKVAPPFKTAELDLMYDSGFSAEGDLLDMGIRAKIVDKSGSWLNYGDLRLGQGRENAKQYLKENPDVFAGIAKKLRDQYTGEVETQPHDPEEETEPEE